MHREQFTPAELRRIRAFKSPHGVQSFLDKIPYHEADTAWSPRQVLLEQTAHCLEGSIFAAAALRVLGHPPLILDLEAVNDTDHVIAVYRRQGCWGSIAASSFTGLRGRAPVYRTLRELAMSYFQDYFNLRGERTLRTFSRPVDLTRFDHRDWMTSSEPIWYIADYLLDIPHTQLLTASMLKTLTRVDRRTLLAGQFGQSKTKKLKA